MRLVEVEEIYNAYIIPKKFAVDYQNSPKSVNTYENSVHLRRRKTLIDVDSIYHIEPIDYVCEDLSDMPKPTKYTIYFGHGLESTITPEEYERLIKIIFEKKETL